MLQIPIIFHVVSVGSHYPFKRHRVPHFLPNVTHFSRLTPIFAHIFPVLYHSPQFWQFLCFGLLYWPPSFSLFIFRVACGTPVMLLSLRSSGFRTQLPPKIGSLAKTFLLAPFLRLVENFQNRACHNEVLVVHILSTQLVRSFQWLTCFISYKHTNLGPIMIMLQVFCDIFNKLATYNSFISLNQLKILSFSPCNALFSKCNVLNWDLGALRICE